MFGEFIKQIRERERVGLREFCLENGYDPSNWSKIEREVLPPPRDEGTLRTWAKALGLKQGSEDWLKFFDYAAVDSGRIPDYVLKDEKLVAQLPAFFRTISGQKPSSEDLARLVELIKSANRP
jgi:transcriptional regulator with XRE-family HTH domain